MFEFIEFIEFTALGENFGGALWCDGIFSHYLVVGFLTRIVLCSLLYFLFVIFPFDLFGLNLEFESTNREDLFLIPTE